jgi:hypothetical protein
MVKCDNSFKTTKQSQSFRLGSPQKIGDTNLTTGTYYYIRDIYGKYLRWDGNHDNYKDGLYFDAELKDNYQREWYLFSLEVNGSSIRIKNSKTNGYFHNLEEIELVLIDSTTDGELGFEWEEEFVLSKTKDNWFVIQSKTGNFMTPNILNPFELLLRNSVYRLYMNYSLDRAAKVKFIKVENSSKIIKNNNYILGTNLSENSNYCIRTVNEKNETKFLRSDGQIFRSHNIHFYNLFLDTVSDNECPDSEEFLFTLERDEFSIDKYVRIKNKKTNNYIRFWSKGYFILSDLKMNTDYRLNLILSPNDTFRIKTYDIFSNQSKYLSESFHSSQEYWGLYLNVAVQQINESADFVFVKKEIKTKLKSDANLIKFNFYNKLLSVFVIMILYHFIQI